MMIIIRWIVVGVAEALPSSGGGGSILLFLGFPPLLPHFLELYKKQQFLKGSFVAQRSRHLPSGVRLEPCFCIVTWALRWFKVPYAFEHSGQEHWYNRSISS